MAQPLLGNLEKVDLRKIWKSESSEFTPWLAKEENLRKLGEALNIRSGIGITGEKCWSVSADILCKDVNSQQWVLIENQIERTDHNHLGQLMTYAAGLKAVIIIWIAREFTDEHRAALDWLNEITTDEINFFGIEIELWKIGDSPVAPKFNVVSKPNEWTHSVSQATQAIEKGELTETQKLQFEYWTKFNEFMKRRQSPIRPQKAFPQHWMNFAIGRSNFVMYALANAREKQISVGLSMTGPYSKAHYHLLDNEKAEIEQQIGQALEWREQLGRNESRITLHRLNSDVATKAQWEEYFVWMADTLEKFSRVFRSRIQNLDADDYVPAGQSDADDD